MSVGVAPRFPVESVTCLHCLAELPVADGVDPRDLLWLHERRCGGEALFPEISVVCGACELALPIGAGLGPVETLWMHDLDCPDGLAELSATG
jgi:hypothetical protein